MRNPLRTIVAACMSCLFVIPAQAATVTLLHYNDLHAHLTPHLDRVPDAPLGQTSGASKIVERGGIARLATAVKQARAQDPQAVLMNIGDTYHGGVEALYTLGNAIIAPMDALGVDIGVPGNWDFAYGPVVTRLRYTNLTSMERTMLTSMAGMMNPGISILKPNFPNLAANVTYTMPFYKRGTNLLPPTWVTERNGVKMGFIGVSSDIVPKMSSTLAMGLDFVQGEDNYRALIEKHARALRTQGARLVFVMSELGNHKDHRLAQVIAPNLGDVFFSAHTHEATFTPLSSASGALVVEAGNDGYLGRMDVTVSIGKKPQFNWKLIPLDASIPEDPAMKLLVSRARAPFLAANPNLRVPLPYADQWLTQPISTVVGHSDGPLDRRQALENAFNATFSESLRQFTGTQLALTPGFRFDAVTRGMGELLEDNTLSDGQITLEDVYRFFPVVYTMASGEVSGAQLKNILEQSLTSVYSKTAFNQAGGWFEGFAGLGMEIDVAGNDGARVSRIWLSDSGQTIADSDVFSITGCQRPDDAADVLCSHSGFSNVRALIDPKTGAPWTVADMFVSLLAQGTLLSTRSHITDTSNTPVWPQAPFVQPLWQ
jgi:2',3'-cyclic-nucleotide 2'-phosphodiesterase (5'-nucleotidase family)